MLVSGSVYSLFLGIFLFMSRFLKKVGNRTMISFLSSKKSQKSQVVFSFEEFTPEKNGFMIHVVMWYHHHFQTAWIFYPPTRKLKTRRHFSTAKGKGARFQKKHPKAQTLLPQFLRHFCKSLFVWLVCVLQDCDLWHCTLSHWVTCGKLAVVKHGWERHILF